MIPLVDLSRRHNASLPLLKRAFAHTVASGDYILGDSVTRFEMAFASFLKSKYAVGVSNGTDALLLALKALDIGPGDEVIVPAFTFVSTAFAVLLAGAVPVFVDVDPETLTLDPMRAKKAMTRRTKAIIPVHLYGMPADMTAFQNLAAVFHTAVIEDAAQSLGSIYRKRSAGTIGTIGCFSFYPSKNLGALGDSGAISTNSKRLSDRIKRLSNLGSAKKYIHTQISGNHRLDTLQAAFLLEELPFLSSWNAKRQAIALQYSELLSGLPITLPSSLAGRETNYHLFVIRTRYRTALQQYLRSKGIQTGIHYPLPLHLQPALRSLGYKRGMFPVSEHAAQTVLSLPLFPELTDREVVHIARTIRSFFS